MKLVNQFMICVIVELSCVIRHFIISVLMRHIPGNMGIPVGSYKYILNSMMIKGLNNLTIRVTTSIYMQ